MYLYTFYYIQIFVLFHRFSINLQCGKDAGSNIVLHFNPRFNENCVVRNTKRNGTWEREERGGFLPFKKQQPFEIILHVDSQHFKVNLFEKSTEYQIYKMIKF